MNKLASFPLQALGFAGAPDEHVIIGIPEWQLTVGDVRAARRVNHPDLRALLLQMLTFEGQLVQGDVLAHTAEAILRATMGDCEAGAHPLPSLADVPQSDYLAMHQAREAAYPQTVLCVRARAKRVAFTRGWQAKAATIGAT